MKAKSTKSRAGVASAAPCSAGFGRSPIRLALYLCLLLILAPISLALDLAVNALDTISEWADRANKRLSSLSDPVKRWAEIRKPNADVVASVPRAISDTHQTQK
jgi:hypothetical protein